MKLKKVLLLLGLTVFFSDVHAQRAVNDNLRRDLNIYLRDSYRENKMATATVVGNAERELRAMTGTYVLNQSGPFYYRELLVVSISGDDDHRYLTVRSHRNGIENYGDDDLTKTLLRTEIELVHSRANGVITFLTRNYDVTLAPGPLSRTVHGDLRVVTQYILAFDLSAKTIAINTTRHEERNRSAPPNFKWRKIGEWDSNTHHFNKASPHLTDLEFLSATEEEYAVKRLCDGLLTHI